MKSALLALTAVLILIAAPAQAAVGNVNLTAVGDSGVCGMATLIVGSISGTTPYTNVEINVRLNKTPSENMVYEGWLVDKDADYKLSVGAFNGMRLSARHKLVQFAPYDAVAVSLEPANDTNPMPTTIVAMGDLPGASVSGADFARIAILPQDEMFQRQIVMQRFGLTSDQVTDLRMSGCGYSDIAVVANVASRCNKLPSEVAGMLEQGQTWDQIAQACNTTVATLLEPVPVQAVAGFRAEIRPGMVQPLVVYRRYANGRAIITQETWMYWHKRGYFWRDVAIAANVAAMTGEEVGDLLTIARVQGKTWRQIAFERALYVDEVMDVSGWPFSTDSAPMVRMPPEEMPAPAPPPPMTPPGTPTY